jgi:hypothetical protein
MMALLPFRLMQQHTLPVCLLHTNLLLQALLLWRNWATWCNPRADGMLLLQDHTRLLLLLLLHTAAALLLLQRHTAAALLLWPYQVLLLLLLLLGLVLCLLLPACPVR